jgi:hypothetical protein
MRQNHYSNSACTCWIDIKQSQTCDLFEEPGLVSISVTIRTEVESQVRVEVESGTAMASNLTRCEETPSVKTTGPPALHAS